MIIVPHALIKFDFLRVLLALLAKALGIRLAPLPVAFIR